MAKVTGKANASDDLAMIDWYDPQERDETAAVFDDEEQVRGGLEEDEPDDDELIRAREALRNRSGFTPRIKALRKAARESSIGLKQRTIFLSAAELDEIRKPKEQMGLAKLFEAWCSNGNENWLNPIAELKPVTENLGNFSGRARALRPMIFVLLQLARSGISPAEFVRYVVIPRMAFDHDWRRWRDRHYWALNRIAEVLIAMRGQRPFADRYLGEGRTLTDIVLVKYVGKPLARFPTHVLEDEALIRKYQAAWQRLRLSNPVFLLFLRTNVFPFLYRLSGKVDLIQLVPIMTYAAELEPRFDRVFANSKDSTVAEIFSVSLYKDFEANMTARQNKGLTTYSLVREIKAYLRMIRTLIDSNSGIYLSGYFAALLRSALDPDGAEALAETLPNVRDTGGMLAYRWHARRVVSLEQGERNTFVAAIRQYGGLNPEYPHRNPEQLFAGFGADHETAECERLAASLEPPVSETAPTGFRDLRDAYRHRHPERRALIDGCIADLLTGRDRGWQQQQIRGFDSLGPVFHRLLIYSTIPGVARGFSTHTLKARSFAELFTRYAAANAQPAISMKHSAAMTERVLRDTGAAQNTKLQQRVRFALLRRCARVVLEHQSPLPLQEFIRLLNRRGQELDDAARRQREHDINRGESQNSRALTTLKTQRARIQQVFSAWDELTEPERFVTAIIVSARIAKRGDELESFAIAQFLERFSKQKRVAERLEYLRQDLAPDRMTLRQLGFLINTIETMLAAAREQWKRSHSPLPAGANLRAAALPFSMTGHGKLAADSFETAARSLFSLPHVETERACWRDRQDQLSGANPQLRTLIFSTGKSAIDAYFGDMGGSVWAQQPEAITRPGVQVLRIGDKSAGQIIGSALLTYSKHGIPSLGIESFFSAFGFTVIRERLCRWSRKQWLFVYFQYRWVLEQIAHRTGMPIFLPGLGTPAVVSGSPELAELILRYERWTEAPEARDAAGIAVYYPESAFRRGLLIIDPRSERGFHAEGSIANLRLD